MFPESRPFIKANSDAHRLFFSGRRESAHRATRANALGCLNAGKAWIQSWQAVEGLGCDNAMLRIRNNRTQLRRNDPEPSAAVQESLDKLSRDAKKASSAEKLLGIEGAAADLYFGRLDSLLKGDEEFSFQSRNRRSPKDPVNAVLSHLYAVLAKEMFVTLLAVCFDPYLGFYHRPRYGRPALALDMMEEFRPVIADSTAIYLFNNRELSERDFIKTSIGVTMTPKAKKRIIQGYERRMETEISHPLFGYTVSYRRIFEVQARLLARVLSGEISEYPAFTRR